MVQARARHLSAAALGLGILWMAFFSGAGTLGLIGPDEPRYAAVAREMAETGDWITPRLNGQPWFEKPILYYWGAALSFRLFGESDAAARLPSAFAAAVSTLALVLLGGRLYGWPAAYALLLILPTMVAAIGFARAASTDMLFASSLTLALVAAMRVIEAGLPTDLAAAARSAEVDARRAKAGGAGRTGLAWLAAWGAFLGLAILAKGPAALVLAGGSVGLWMVLTRRWADAIALAHPVAIAAAAVVATPWYVLCAIANPEFFRVFVIEHNFQRFLTPVFAHQQPLWYFVPVLIAGLVPWTALLVPVAGDVRRWLADARDHPLELLAVCWAAVPFAFFTLSESKLPGYILPVFPPLALLMARSVAAAAATSSRASRVLTAVGLTFVVLGLAVAVATRGLTPEETRRLLVALGASTWAFCLGIAGVVVTLLALRQRPWAAMTVASIVTASLLMAINERVVPALDAQLTARAAAGAAQRAAGGRAIYVHDLDRAWNYGLGYYVRRELPPWTEGEAGLVITTSAGVKNLAGRGYTVDVIERIADEAVLTTVRAR